MGLRALALYNSMSLSNQKRQGVRQQRTSKGYLQSLKEEPKGEFDGNGQNARSNALGCDTENVLKAAHRRSLKFCFTNVDIGKGRRFTSLYLP